MRGFKLDYADIWSVSSPNKKRKTPAEVQTIIVMFTSHHNLPVKVLFPPAAFVNHIYRLFLCG